MKLSARETATLLGRNIRTVRGQLARGELPGVKEDGRWVVKREDGQPCLRRAPTRA